MYRICSVLHTQYPKTNYTNYAHFNTAFLSFCPKPSLSSFLSEALIPIHFQDPFWFFFFPLKFCFFFFSFKKTNLKAGNLCCVYVPTSHSPQLFPPNRSCPDKDEARPEDSLQTCENNSLQETDVQFQITGFASKQIINGKRPNIIRTLFFLCLLQ